jgi:hypothetical protein
VAELVGRGHDAGRLQREAEGMITVLRADMAPEDLREVLDEVREELAAGVEAVEEQASEIEAEDKAGQRQVQRLVGALAAARDTFGRAALSL